MEVILREDVPHLGTIGDIVKVRAGYARNYLLPRGLATVADKRNVKALEHERRLVEEKRKRALSAAEAFAKQLTAARIVTARRRGASCLDRSPTSTSARPGGSGVKHEQRRIRLDEPIKTSAAHRARDAVDRRRLRLKVNVVAAES